MAINRNGPGEAAVGMGVEGDVGSSDEDGVEGCVMSHDRHSTEGIIAEVERGIDDESKRGVEAYLSVARIPIVNNADAVTSHRCICTTLRASPHTIVFECLNACRRTIPH